MALFDFLFRFAVVTGGNKGIGFEVCKQLASNGVMVVLTARDEKKGFEAVEKFKDLGLSHFVVFHQLDVVHPFSVHSLVEFINTEFPRLDILVNNAGIIGAEFDEDGYKKTSELSNGIIQTYELAEQCLETNYYGAKRMVEGLIPFLQLSDSPRIVNVSSSIGILKNIQNVWAKEILSDAENLTEERVDEVLSEFLNSFEEGSLESKCWPSFLSAYTVSKAALNAYTRILAKKYPSFCINSVCPGYVKTDLTRHNGILSVEEGGQSPVNLALLPNGGPSGLFFVRKQVSSF